MLTIRTRSACSGRRWKRAYPALLIAALIGACEDPAGAGFEPAASAAPGRSIATARLTGTVDVVWPGGQGGGAPAAEGRYSQAEISAHAGVAAGVPGPGSFYYRVLNVDGTVHREIGVRLTWAGEVDRIANPGELRFIGVVESDTKPCGGSGMGSGETGGCSHEDGGCSGDDGTSHDDGGCSGDDGTSHDSGGCSGDDGTDHDGGGCAGGQGGPGGPGGRVTGADCRIGQIVIGWALDAGTPAVNGDAVSWKWFAPDAPKVQEITAAIGAGTTIPWPCKLCEKEIMAGNITLMLLN